MYSYLFVGEDERVFGHLQHGVNATVESGADVTMETGETVLLRPGDTLFVEALEEHTELQPADAATADAHAGVDEAEDLDDEDLEEQLPTRKPELQELARARGLDDTGTVADLTARLSSQE